MAASKLGTIVFGESLDLAKRNEKDVRKDLKFRAILKSEDRFTYGSFVVKETRHYAIKLPTAPPANGSYVLVEGGVTYGDDGECYLYDAEITILDKKK
jgi:hypothetical protein